MGIKLSLLSIWLDKHIWRDKVINCKAYIPQAFSGRVRADNAIDFMLGTFQIILSPPQQHRFLKGVDVIMNQVSNVPHFD